MIGSELGGIWYKKGGKWREYISYLPGLFSPVFLRNKVCMFTRHLTALENTCILSLNVALLSISSGLRTQSVIKVFSHALLNYPEKYKERKEMPHLSLPLMHYYLAHPNLGKHKNCEKGGETYSLAGSILFW